MKIKTSEEIDTITRVYGRKNRVYRMVNNENVDLSPEIETAFFSGYVIAQNDMIESASKDWSEVFKELEGTYSTTQELLDHKSEVEFIWTASQLSSAKKIQELETELKQQRFNNAHNLSIDQKVVDEIKSLRSDLDWATSICILALTQMPAFSEQEKDNHDLWIERNDEIRQRHCLDKSEEV